MKQYNCSLCKGYFWLSDRHAGTVNEMEKICFECSDNFPSEILRKENEYLKKQNKAFQEQYNETGEEVNKLRDQNKQLLDALIEDTKHMEWRCKIQGCHGTYEKYYKDNTKLIESIKNKPWEEIIKE